MINIKKVSIIGLGAIGSAYLSQILKFMPIESVSVIAEGIRAENFNANGVSIFAGTVVDLGREYRVPTPVNQMLLDIIRALEGICRHSKLV